MKDGKRLPVRLLLAAILACMMVPGGLTTTAQDDSLAIDGVEIACGPDIGQVTANIAVTSAARGNALRAVLNGPDGEIADQWVLLNDFTTDYAVTFALEDALEGDVSVALTEAVQYPDQDPIDAEPALPVTSNVLTVSYETGESGSAMGCVAAEVPVEQATPAASGVEVDEASPSASTPEVVAPTFVPTEEPTEVPTEEPTEIPTEEPTEVPTEEPTEIPTEEPTEAPTEVPTEEPTEVPTEEPIEVPTEEPTEVPTEEPTATPSPTPEPTEEPTPTPSPTPSPTPEPTEEPTATPTPEPTATPSPTPSPTPEPTEEPTATPTPSPTPSPTPEPTEEPTATPTPEPTEVPTEVPTEEPTEVPTEEPTEEPTEVPTEEPTEEPTEVPTEEPTVEPTPSPTPEPARGVVTGTGGLDLNCRAEPNLNAEILTAFGESTILDVLGPEEDGWYPVRCGSEGDGWVDARYLTVEGEDATVTPEPEPATTTVTTNGQPAACRAEATGGSPIVASVPNGTVLDVRGEPESGFVPVVCDGQDGWIAGSLLNP